MECIAVGFGKPELSPLELDPSSSVLRTMPRPAPLRQSSYEEEFDFRTIFYDCFVSADGTWRIFLGPPLLNLEEIVLPAVPMSFNCRTSSDIVLRNYGLRTSQLWLRTWKNRADLPAGIFRQSEIAIQPNHFRLFRDRKVLLTLSKDNDLQWIRDWVHFFVRKHAADAVLFYDNNSTKYEIADIEEAILSIHGVEAAAVVPWPYKYGPQGWSCEPQLPWDSNFSQSGVLEHARLRFLTLAQAVINADIDELVLTKNGVSVFELVEKSNTGYLQYSGQWIEGATDSSIVDRSPRHVDFTYRFAAPTEQCTSKWVVAPRRAPQHAYWCTHAVAGMEPDPLSEAVSHRHFRAINTGWYKGEGAWIEKYPRGEIQRPNERDYLKDEELISWMQVFKLSDAESRACYLADQVKAREREIEVLSYSLAIAEKNITKAEQNLATAELKIAAHEAELQSFRSSISWRVTRPLRRLHYIFPGAGMFVIHVMKLIWWTLTLKLYRKIPLHLNPPNRENAAIIHGQDVKIDAYPSAHLDCQVQDDPFASMWNESTTTWRRDLLARTQRAAEKSGVSPQLYGGTLLGYVREGKILDWDDDIDLALFAEDNLQDFLSALHVEGLQTYFWDGTNNIKIYDQAYEQIPGRKEYTWPYIDVFTFHDEGEMLSCKACHNGVAHTRRRVLPSKRSEIFEGCMLWLPKDEFYLLDFFYSDWRTSEVTGTWNHRLEVPSIRETRRRAIVTVNGRKVTSNSAPGMTS
jgi:hypothetical protein